MFGSQKSNEADLSVGEQKIRTHKELRHVSQQAVWLCEQFIENTATLKPLHEATEDKQAFLTVLEQELVKMASVTMLVREKLDTEDEHKTHTHHTIRAKPVK